MNRIIVKNLVKNPIEQILDFSWGKSSYFGIKSYVFPYIDSNNRNIGGTFIYNMFGGSENL